MSLLALLHRVRTNDVSLKRLVIDDIMLFDLGLRGTQVDIAGMALANALKVNGVLESVTVESLAVGDTAGVAFAEALKANQKVKALQLTGGLLSNTTMAALAEVLRANETLRTLHLKEACRFGVGEKTGVAMAEALMTNRVLESLEIVSPWLGDGTGVAMARALRENGTLKELRLAGGRIGDETGVAVAGALKANTSLKSLSLDYWVAGETDSDDELEEAEARGHRLHREGVPGRATGKAMAEALLVNGVLTSLSLCGQELDDEAGAALAGALKRNTALKALLVQFGHGLGFVDSLAAALRSNAAVESVKLLARDRGSLFMEAAGVRLMKGLEANSRLRKLCVDGLPLKEQGAAALGRMLGTNCTLRSLRIHGLEAEARAGEVLAGALRVNTSLRVLKLEDVASGYGALGVALAEALGGNRALETLRLSCAEAGSAEEARVRSAFERALEANATLKSLALPGRDSGGRLAACLERNRGLPRHWWHLRLVARCGSDPGVRAAVEAMSERGFCRAVFAFLLPGAAADGGRRRLAAGAPLSAGAR